MKGHIFTLILAILSSMAVEMYAKPAKQGIMTMTTADGEELNVRLTGDEFFHQYFTEDDIPLIEKAGNFYYCDYDDAGNIIESGIKATNVANRTANAKMFVNKVDKGALEQRIHLRAEKSPRRASLENRFQTSGLKAAPQAVADVDGPPYEKGYGLFSSVHFPAYGNQKAIVILVEYTDVKFNASYDAHDYFSRMLNQDDFNDYGGTGSAAQYFRENSLGAFIPEFDVYGPIQLAHNQAYYGGNDSWGNDKNPGAMVKEACDALDPTVNFKDYDRDNDGIVDNIFVFYAGRGEASGGSSNSVWPHSWDMVSAGFPNLRYDGVQIYTYGCSNEWEGYRPDGVGTFIHEFSHVMGLPDLYATSYTSAFTPGAWSALDYGPYNNSGMTPPNYGAFERYALGWVKPWEINRPLSATLQSVDNNVCGIIRTTKATEFFLLENRQQTGWDKYIPHHGMLIWHIDYNASVWNQNIVNNSANHQYVDIEEADGTQNSYSVKGDPFPGNDEISSFTSETDPAMKTWGGKGLDFPITDITEEDGVITFKVLGGFESEIDPLEVNEAEDITTSGFTLSWSEPLEENDVCLNVYTRDENDEPVYLYGYRNRNVGHVTSVTMDGLESKTIYYFTVAQTNGWETSVFSEEKSVRTAAEAPEYFVVEATEATDVDETSFTANWLQLDGATEYYLTVYTKEFGDVITDDNGFDNGLNDLGEWTVSDEVATYGLPSYAGKAAPALRIPDGSSLTTPVYDDYITELSFWHRGNSTTDGDRVEVYAETPEGKVLAARVEVISTVGGVVTSLDSLPEATKQIEFRFVRAGDKGYLALDDVTIGHGREFTALYLPDYNDAETGNVLSYTVDGLDPLTDYYYTIRATDGEVMSRPSNEIKVTTDGDQDTGKVDDSWTDSVQISVDGLTVSSNSDAEIIITDIAGVIVARGVGHAVVPSPGFYIATIPSAAYVRKLMLQ